MHEELTPEMLVFALEIDSILGIWDASEATIKNVI
jgi:hypothetical protein